MATVTTSTRTDPLVYPSVSHIDRSTPGGSYNLWVAVINNAGTGIDWWRGTSAGTGWTLVGTYSPGHSIVEMSSIFLDNVGAMWFAYRANISSQDRIYMNRMYDSSSFVSSAGVNLAAIGNGGVAGSVFQGLDLTVVRLGDGTYRVVVAAGTQSGANQGVTLYPAHVSASGVFTYQPSIVATKRQWLTAGTGRVTPSIEIEHTGDGRSGGGGSPPLWVAFGRSSLWVAKCAWTGSSWTGPSSANLLVAGVTSQDSMTGRWAGQEFVACCDNPSDGTTVLLVQRNRANTQTTSYVTQTHPTGVVRSCTLSYDTANRDVRVYAIGTSTGVLYYCDFIRASSTFTTWSTVTATAVLGSPPLNYGVRRSTSGSAKYDVVTAHSGSPNTIVHTQQSLSYAPTAPTWQYGTNATTPSANGVAMDVSSSMILDWLFSDVDPGDTQSAFALSRQIGAGTIAYYRASDSSWQASEQQNSSSSSQVTLAAATWATGGASADPHTYRVKVWDSGAASSPYSSPLTIIPSAKANPSFSTPTSGGTITGDKVTVTWTVSEQTAYRLTLSTNPGGVLTYDSNWVLDSTTSHTPPLSLATGTGWTIGLTTRNLEGLASNTVTRNFSVSYVTPATPTTAAFPQPALGVIRITITNPTPGGGQPALASQILYRRVVGDTSDGIAVAADLGSGAVYDDFEAVDKVNYEYRSVASGVNGTSVAGAWTP